VISKTDEHNKPKFRGSKGPKDEGCGDNTSTHPLELSPNPRRNPEQVG